MQPYYAHSVPTDPSRQTWELLSDHLNQVGDLSAQFARAFNFADIGAAMGLLHDIGKTATEYQNYISSPPTPGAAKGPDHSTAGAIEAVQLYGPTLGRIMAFGIAGHHAGLTNGRDGQGEGAGRSLTTRLESRDSIPNYAGWERHVENLPTAQDLAKTIKPPTDHAASTGFAPFFLTRMLFSCLVDADFIATERFYASAENLPEPKRGGTIRQAHLDQVRLAMAAKCNGESPVNALRADILNYALSKAALRPGLFTLTVPTGGGKTLTSLNFALDHALRWRKQRIVYVIPFTSIIEQTADVFRGVLQSNDDVLEHHSNFDWDAVSNTTPPENADDEGREGLAKLRRDAENWDAPIIVTTAVQFFESLFARRTSRCRKLHNLADSVIIIDEAQTIPVQLLRPCMAALDELARNYGATVILCTATQPALRVMDNALPKTNPPQGFDIGDDRELAPDPTTLYRKLQRVEVNWLPNETDDEAIANRFAQSPQMLCIVNTRGHARELFEQIGHMDGARHLTTLMCAKHRRAALAEIRARLSDRLPVRLVATSLIEAGVDVDFPEVWRAAAGLDSIAQAAGRCNREGRLDGMGKVTVFEAKGRKIPPAIKAQWQAGRAALRTAIAAGEDPLGLKSVHHYFRELYFNRGLDALDSATLDGARYPIMDNIRDTAGALAFPFAAISDAFQMIDDVMQPVLIPFDEDAVVLLNALEYAPVPPAGILRKLQQYSVSIPQNAFRVLLSSGAVQAIQPEIYGTRFMRLVNADLYNDRFGLQFDNPIFRNAEANIV